MKRTVATVLAILLATPFSAVAQSTSTGLTGLGEMRTPDTIPDNSGEITFVPARYSVISNGFASGLNESTRTTPSIGYTQGIGDRFEAGVMVPFFMHEFKKIGVEREQSDSGIANVPVAVKYRFLEWNRFRFAGDAGVEIPASSKEDQYGSGNVGYSANLLGTMDVGSLVFSGSLGYASTDTCPRCTYAGLAVPEPETASLVNGAAGLSYSSRKGYGAFFEVHGMNAYSEAGKRGAIDGDPDLYALLGGRVPIGRNFAVTGYGGAGVVPDGSNTQAVGALMLHYSFARSRPLARSTYGSTATAVAAVTPTPAPTPVAVAVATPLRVATPAPTPRPTPVAVVAPLRRTLTPAQLALQAKLTSDAHFVFDGVTFSGATGALLAPVSSAPLSDLAAVLLNHPEAKLRIEAHVDPTDPGALPTSQMRADAVLSKMQSFGVPPTQLEAKGMGGSKSLFPSFLEATKAKNRRVEIDVLVPPAGDARVPVAAATPVRKPLTPAQTAVKSRMTPEGNFTLDGVTFTTAAGAVLASASTEPLANLAAVLENHPEAKVRIEGHVDPTDKNPVPVSQLRAEAVFAKLKALGVSASQMEPKGLGGTKSLFPSFVEAMKAKNRRIMITVLSPPVDEPGTATAAVPPPGAVTGDARVKVLASKGMNARAVRLANELKAAGTKIARIASVGKTYGQSQIYYTPKYRFEAEQLAKQLPGAGPKLVAYKSLGEGVDIVLLVGSDLR